jgi:hypothetical protein
MVLSKSKDLIYKLLTEAWREFFGTMDYNPSNYDPETGLFKHHFLEFLEDGSHHHLPKSEVPPQFVDLVKMRQRAVFLFEYVMIQHFNEESQVFILNVGCPY